MKIELSFHIFDVIIHELCLTENTLSKCKVTKEKKLSLADVNKPNISDHNIYLQNQFTGGVL